MNNLFENITNEYIQTLPLTSFEGDIRVIETDEQCAEALKELKRKNVLGFDTETKPTFLKGQYHPTALIQLASHHTAYLFRLSKLNNKRRLFHLFEDADVLKLGISISDDLKDLRRIYSFDPSGFIDLNSTAKEIGLKHLGVRKLAALCLGYRISKGQQTSNWENEELTEAQQLYAATDAWICLAIYEKLKNQGYI